MSSDVALAVNDLAKAYTIRHNLTAHITLAELALDRLRHPMRRAEKEQFWALDDVNFELREGEVLGLIGRNGAGKSTLLKVLSRITEPTRGEVRLWGRVGSLLEVGTGFHTELTGRENIYLNGSILGMGRKEIASKFDAIVEFAGVESFLDTPVKRYSSGMYVRLAFAVAAHLDSEILLLDEVLAVGDADFQARCLGKVSDLAKSGRTVVLVSHNMVTVGQFASRALVLSRGRVQFDGEVGEAIDRYLLGGEDGTEDTDVASIPRYEPRQGLRARITKVRLDNATGQVAADEPLSYWVSVHSNEDLGPLRVSQLVYMSDGRPVGNSFSTPSIFLKRGCTTTFRVSLVHPNLAAGRYHLGIVVGFGDNLGGMDDIDTVLNVVPFEITPSMTAGGAIGVWHDTWGPIRMDQPVIEEMTIDPSE